MKVRIPISLLMSLALVIGGATGAALHELRRQLESDLEPGDGRPAGNTIDEEAER